MKTLIETRTMMMTLSLVVDDDDELAGMDEAERLSNLVAKNMRQKIDNPKQNKLLRLGRVCNFLPFDS